MYRTFPTKLAQNKKDFLERKRRIKRSPTQTLVHCEDNQQIAFCSNDYLGLASHPDIIQAFKKGLDDYGAGAGASQIVSGYTKAHQELEETFANFMGFERSLYFSNGYMANLGILTAFCSRDDYIYQDRLNHASLIDAAKLSAATLKRFRHSDVTHLENLLQQNSTTHSWIVTDGVFSTHGEIANLKPLATIARSHQAMLIVDDAHSIGVLGASGKGTMEYCQLTPADITILVCPLGKAFGAYGALVSGTDELIEYLTQFSRPYLYTTAPPPAIAVAALKSLQIIEQENWRREKLNQLIAYFRKESATRNLNFLVSQTPIQSLPLDDIEQAVFLYEKLFTNGYWVGLLRPPTTPPHQAMLRVTLNVHHTNEQIEQMLNTLAELTQNQSKSQSTILNKPTHTTVKPNLVLLHGWGFHSEIWQQLRSQLSDYTVTCIDLPGFGKNSTAISSHSIDSMIDYVLEHAPPQANYLGWSLGGLIAIAIAIHFPERVQKLMTIGSSPHFLETEHWPGMTEHVLQTFTQEIQKNHSLGLRRFILTHLKDLNSSKEIRSISNNMLQLTPQLETLENGLELLKATDLRKQLPNIQCPQLYCFGERDSLVPATVAEELKKLSPKVTTHLFSDAGHIAFLSHYNEFLTTTRNFFK